MDEPPSKIAKIDESSEPPAPAEEQEEWLSEGVLTDDDNLSQDQDKKDANSSADVNSSQDGSTEPADVNLQDSTFSDACTETLDSTKPTSDIQDEANAELNSQDEPKTDNESQDDSKAGGDKLEESETQDEDQEMKTEVAQVKDDTEIKIANVNKGDDDPPSSELDDDEGREEGDGNDTDDLLRMLGDGDAKAKPASKTVDSSTAGDKAENTSEKSNWSQENYSYSEDEEVNGVVYKKIGTNLKIRTEVKSALATKQEAAPQASDKGTSKAKTKKLPEAKSSGSKVEAGSSKGAKTKMGKAEEKVSDEQSETEDSDGFNGDMDGSFYTGDESTDEGAVMTQIFRHPNKLNPKISGITKLTPKNLNQAKTPVRQTQSKSGDANDKKNQNKTDAFSRLVNSDKAEKKPVPPKKPTPKPAPAKTNTKPGPKKLMGPAKKVLVYKDGKLVQAGQKANKGKASKAVAKSEEDTDFDESELGDEDEDLDDHIDDEHDYDDSMSEEEAAGSQSTSKPRDKGAGPSKATPSRVAPSTSSAGAATSHQDPGQSQTDMSDDTEGQTEDTDFDDLPSTPSTEAGMESEWTLDVRAERAGDYLPLLGARAAALLSEERASADRMLGDLMRSRASILAELREQRVELTALRRQMEEIDAQHWHQA